MCVKFMCDAPLRANFACLLTVSLRRVFASAEAIPSDPVFYPTLTFRTPTPAVAAAGRRTPPNGCAPPTSAGAAAGASSRRSLLGSSASLAVPATATSAAPGHPASGALGQGTPLAASAYDEVTYAFAIPLPFVTAAPAQHFGSDIAAAAAAAAGRRAEDTERMLRSSPSVGRLGPVQDSRSLV